MRNIYKKNNTITFKLSKEELDFWETAQHAIEEYPKKIERNIQLYNNFDSMLKDQKYPVLQNITEDFIMVLNDILTIINNQNIILQFVIDASIEIKGIILSTEILEKLYHQNNMYIIIFKGLEKYKNSENQPLSRLIQRYPQMQQEYKKIVDDNRMFDKKYRADVQCIRNTLAAHFEAQYSYNEYFAKISSYDINKTISIIMEFIAVLSHRTSLYGSLTDCVEQDFGQISSDYSNV